MSIKSFLKKVVKYDRAVYWPPVDFDDSGFATVGDPQEIKVRWSDEQMEYIDRKGKKQVSSAVIISEIALDFGGILWHGKKKDLVDEDAPALSNAGAREIRGMGNLPDLRNKVVMHTIYL